MEPDDITLEDGSISILASIRSSCVNLQVLTTSLHSTNSIELRLDSLNNLKVAAKALARIDTRFKAILSVKEINVELFEDGPGNHIRSIMESYGWTIHTTEYVEEEDWERSFSDFDADEHEYDYGSAGDDYDIDNDSDFWRRAAD